ncbi:thioredoxin fold domain-containing protein [bacterium]|nr:thioredoxin fold domain-containing protein [bacterium]
MLLGALILTGCAKAGENAEKDPLKEKGTEAAIEKNEGIIFYTSLEEAKAAAGGEKKFLFFKTKEKPIMIDLYTDSCGWCKELDKNTFSDPTVAAYVHKHVIPLKIPADKDPYFSKKFEVKYYPTILFIDKDENEIDRLSRYYGPEEYLDKLKTFFDDGKTYGNMKSIYENSPDVDNAGDYLYSLHERGMYDETLDVANFILKSAPSDTNAVSVKFQVLFGKQEFNNEELKNEFLSLAKMIEEELDTRYASFKISYCLIISSFYYSEKDFSNTLIYTDKLLSSEEIIENPRLLPRVRLLKVNSLIRNGDLDELKEFAEDLGEKEVAENFIPWVKKLKDPDMLIRFGKFEEAVGNILSQINILWSQGKDIETGSTDLNIPNDPVSGKKLVYRCKLNEQKRPEEFIIRTPSPEKYNTKGLSFDIKTGKLVIELK